MPTDHLKGKVALVTGANKGIGLEIARQLGQQGSGAAALASAAGLAQPQAAVPTMVRPAPERGS